jgi:DNA topoisomerase-6 subunit B
MDEHTEGTKPDSNYIAVELAKKQKEISVAEFFERNKQLLGFDSLTRAVLTSVKEAVDNALDACEEAGILPDLVVKIEPSPKKNEFVITVEDNGPGIVKRQIPHIFGRLLYGSRFHAVRQSRGQQGIGISAVVMYSQLTTGKPSKIISKIGPDQPAYEVELFLDTKKNLPEVVREEVRLWNEKDHGTRFQSTIVGRYLRGKQSVMEYLKEVAIVNPHVHIAFMEPDGTVTEFKRATDKIPKPCTEIKPHPQGIELGTLLNMAKATNSFKMTTFLETEFCRVSARSASQICEAALIDEDMRPQDMNLSQAARMIESFNTVKLMMPPTDCLSPIGEILIKKGMKKEKPADFVVTHTRPKPSVYSGNPFQVEAGLVYGGDLPKDESIQILRFANRIPLLFQQGACVITKAVEDINWKRYGLDQKGGKGIPVGPVMLVVHVASTKIPYTSESKEAIAEVPEIKNEVELAIRACAKKMCAHIRKKKKYKRMKEKETLIRQIIPLIAQRSAKIVGKPVPDYESIIAKIMNSVLIDDKIEFDPKKAQHVITLEVMNYTKAGKTFDFMMNVPTDAQVVAVDPKPQAVEEQNIVWRVTHLKMLERKAFRVVLSGMDQDAYDENELYVRGIDPELVSGAESFDAEAYAAKREEEADDEGDEMEGDEEEVEEAGEVDEDLEDEDGKGGKSDDEEG